MKNMQKSKEISFTQGSVGVALIQFALPVLGALILQAAYGAVDLLVIGMFSDAASISAVGTGSTFMSMVTFVITSLAMGSTVTIGRHIGEKKFEKAGDTVGTTIILFLVIGIVFTVLLELFTGSLVNILQVPSESIDKTILYLRICFGGIIVIIIYNVISSVLRGVGNANLPLLFVGIACIINIICDFLFIGVFHMDVAGAALATVLAQLVSVIASVIAESAAYLRGFCGDCILTCALFSCIGHFNGFGISAPVMLQGMISALCIRIPISLIMSKLPDTTLTKVGLAAPISSIFGIVFFMVCFVVLNNYYRSYKME